MAEPVVLPVAQFAPDLPDLIGGQSANIINVIPRTPNSYGAVLGPVSVYDALGSRCQGGAAFLDSAGAVWLFAGDANDLFFIQSMSTTWANVSQTTGGYSTPADNMWRFTYFNGRVIATNYANNVQSYTLGSSSLFADLPGSPPQAKYIAVVKNTFVMLGNTSDPTNGALPQRIWWAAAGDPTNWPTPGSEAAAQVLAGAIDLLGPDGAVAGIVPDLLNADAVIFQQFSVKRASYAGPPDIFTIQPVENARGCIAPDSIVAYGGIAYYWGQDGIYAFDGASSNPIGANRVDKFLYGDGAHTGDLDLSNVARVVGTTDPTNKLIWWAYPSLSASNGSPDRLLAYHWELDRWSLVIDITCETIIKLISIGYTLDQLYTVFGFTVDQIPAPLSSSLWIGGLLSFGIFDTNHKLNFLAGAPLSPIVDTAELQPVPGRRSFVRNARPLIDGNPSQTAQPTVQMFYRDRLSDSLIAAPTVSMNALGTCPQRLSGRYMRARISVPSTGIPGWTNISGVELDLQPQGIR